MTEIISISVDKKQREWLLDNKHDRNCSPSFLLRQKIHEKMQESGLEQVENLKSQRLKIEKLAARNQRLFDFLGIKGLTDEFLEKKAEQ